MGEREEGEKHFDMDSCVFQRAVKPHVELVASTDLTPTLNLEYIVPMILTLNILLDYLIRHVAATATEIPACPPVTPPIPATKARKTVQQNMRTLPVEFLNQPTDRYLRRYRYEKMDMVSRYAPSDYFHRPGRTKLTLYVAHSQGNITHQHGVAIFGYPNQVMVNRKNTVSSMVILFHSSLSCQIHAKAGDFNPPKRRQ